MEQTPKPIEPEGMFSGLNIKAIIVGVLADISSTFILGIILTTVLLVKEHGPEIPDEAIDNLLKSDSTLYLYLLLGLSCTVFGGFIAAKMAGSLAIRHGGWVGAASLISGVLMEMLIEQNYAYPDWYMYISMAGVIPAGTLGGYIFALIKKVDESI